MTQTAAATHPFDQPSPAQVRRLRRFLVLNIPSNLLIAAAMFAVWHFYPFWSMFVIGWMVMGNVAVLCWSLWQLRRQRVETAALGVTAGVIVQMLAGMYLSGGTVLPLMGVLALWPVMIGLAYLGKVWLLRVMLASTASAIGMSLLSLGGDLVGLTRTIPSWIPMVTDAFCIPLFVGFICMFVWHYGNNLSEALAEARSANAALQNSERELEQKVAERTQELARKNAELMQLDELKTRFLSNASHELRSPLTAIRAFSELLADDPTLNETQTEFAHIINSESERLSRLASDLLDLSRMESGSVEWRPRRLDLRSELIRVAEGQRLVAEHKGLTLNVDVPEALPEVEADADGLRRVLLNLLDNALKFTQRGGVVLSASGAGSRVRVAVVDTGPGISAAEQSRVFDRFYQSGNVLTEKPPGAGLGLAICREILAQHGAELRLESAPGLGSCFSFELPCCRPAAGLLSSWADSFQHVAEQQDRQPQRQNQPAR